MTVAEWIEWLKQQPQGNRVVLSDPDTEWLLTLKTSARFRYSDEVPPNTTVVYAEYGDES